MAAPILNGSLTDWTAADVLDKNGSAAGYDVYGRESGGTFYFALQSPVAIGANTTVWFNTDQNTATGFRIFGTSGGAEYNINFDASGIPRLYTGDAGQTLVPGVTVTSAYSADRKIVEFSVPTSALGTPKIVGTLWDVNNSTFLPGNFSGPQYDLTNGSALPARTDFSNKVGIVYSDTTSANFWSTTGYSQLFMAVQNQVAMSGTKYEILTEADLTNLNKLANFDALVFPSFSHVQASQVTTIENTLKIAAEHYGIGLITAGNFMTNSQTGAALSGDPYGRMKSLLDLNIVASGTNGDVTVTAVNSHPVMQEYAAGELIRGYDGVGWLAYSSVTGTGSALATQRIGTQSYNAAISTTTGGTNVHFSTAEVMADNNLLWQAVDYVVSGTGVSAGIQLSRQASIVATRNDMDQAMEMFEVNPDNGAQGIYDKMLPILQQWKNAYNFVGSYYVDIGNDPSEGQMTDWAVSGGYYKQLIAMGNELGSHSVAHPHDTNILTAAQIQSEFQGSRQVIEQQMSQVLGRPFVVDGAAVPGAPETLATSLAIIQYYSYLSGGFSSIGAGYASAFGYLNPAMAAQDKVYLAPNLQFDFSLIEFRGMTPAQAMAEWAAEVADLSRHADVPVLLWPVHDYAIADWPTDPPADSPYTTQMFTDFISRAYNAGAEFVTLDDLAERISAFNDTKLTTSVAGSTLTATVSSPGAGKLALDLDNLGTQKIARVAGWYAYDDDSVFLARNGGTFVIELGAAVNADDATRIIALPMRSELVSLGGNGTDLEFSIFGEGKVVIDLNRQVGSQPVVTGARVESLVGDRLVLDLGAAGLHNVSVETLQYSDVLARTSNDFNGDGKADILTRNEMTGSGQGFLMNGPRYSATATYAWTAEWQVIGGGSDFNGDGKSDILLHNAKTGTGQTLLMNGLQVSSTQSHSWGVGWDVVSAGSDFNNDGKSDILLRNQETGAATILVMNGGAVLAARTVPWGADWHVVGADADFNGDGRSDILVRNENTGLAQAFLMNGVQYVGTKTYPWGADWHVVSTQADFNGDGRSDILVRNEATGLAQAFLMNGVQYAGTKTYPWGADWKVVSAAGTDFNADGKSDILVRNEVTGLAQAFLMDGVNYIGTKTYPWGADWQVISVSSDFNGDNKSDLLVRNEVTGLAQIFLMDGVQYAGTKTYPWGADWQVLSALSDLNADGKSDIVVGNDTTGQVQAFIMNGTQIIDTMVHAWNPDTQVIV